MSLLWPPPREVSDVVEMTHGVSALQVQRAEGAKALGLAGLVQAQLTQSPSCGLGRSDLSEAQFPLLNNGKNVFSSAGEL